MRGLLLGLLGLLAVPVQAADTLQPIPRLEARVTDLTGTLSAGEQADLEQKLTAFEARKGAQLAVLMVATTHPEEIEQYSIRVVEAWKLGRSKKTSDGVLLLLAKDDRTLRFEVGYGLEGALTDATANRIEDEIMRPLLKQGQYYAAIDAGLAQAMKIIDGEPLPPPEQEWQGRGDILRHAPALFIAFMVLSAIMRAIFGRIGGAAASGGLMAVVAYFFSQLLLIGLGVGMLAFVLSLIFGLRGNGWSAGGRGGWGGGFGGLGGGGFGGGGGFSGGGGGFGGGGASGRW
jgi:uncharacterized protein